MSSQAKGEHSTRGERKITIYRSASKHLRWRNYNLPTGGLQTPFTLHLSLIASRYETVY